MIKRNIVKLAVVIISLISFSGMAAPLVMAQNCNPSTTQGAIQCGADQAGGNGQSPSQATTNVNDTTKAIINILSAVVGIAAIIMLIISALSYITSNGDSEKIKKAKNTLVYAIIGLVIVALAQVIANFALTEATTPGTLILLRLLGLD